MKRRLLLNLLTALSLLLCVAVCVLWVRSYFVPDLLQVFRYDADDNWFAERGYHVSCGRGGVAFGWNFKRHPILSAEERANLWKWCPDRGRWHWTLRRQNWMGYGGYTGRRRFGFGRNGYDSAAIGIARYTQQHSTVVVPWALPAMLLAAVPGSLLYRRLRRRPPGLCPRCGYDLRATPGRCPECGAVASVSTTG